MATIPVLSHDLHEREAEQFIREARALHTPTCGAFAERFWRWSNSSEVAYTFAAAVMRQAGYKPFSGFPLVRLGGER